MSAERTITYPVSRVTLRALRAEVLEGPDAGAAKLAEDETLTVGTAQTNHLVLTDPTVSRFHVELSAAKDGVLVVDHGSTNGTSAGAVRLERAVVPPGTVLALGRTRVRVAEAGAESLTVELLGAEALGSLRGRSPVMRRLMARIEKAARSDAPVLLVGESGTGKELIASALHEQGTRTGGPLVTVDCGSLAPNLVASELFGHEKGAFTGADHQHVGAFERADGGTIFLDEVGELPPALQTALLGVLERRRFRRVGGKTELEVDVRVVSATNRDLRAEVNQGSFRLDLYYRLAVVVLAVPPLRERADDIPVLVEHFLKEAGHAGVVEEVFPAPTMAALAAHRWPGNVRELRNVVEASLAMGETPQLEALAPAGGPGAPAGDPFAPLVELPYKDARARLLQDFEARYLAHLVERTKGNVSQAARLAHMDRSHLIDLLHRHKLK